MNKGCAVLGVAFLMVGCWAVNAITSAIMAFFGCPETITIYSCLEQVHLPLIWVVAPIAVGLIFLLWAILSPTAPLGLGPLPSGLMITPDNAKAFGVREGMFHAGTEFNVYPRKNIAPPENASKEQMEHWRHCEDWNEKVDDTREKMRQSPIRALRFNLLFATAIVMLLLGVVRVFGK